MEDDGEVEYDEGRDDGMRRKDDDEENDDEENDDEGYDDEDNDC